ncbi:alpha/beta hydrolase [Herbaspirillum huttiense]|uniref:alpha/beta hydrolase n=1 Tax=Herbaspirillum huttiense TaxID=863372 RepID=UPI00040CA959|nr:alpha/beta hydrolase-fold protein [Herbaspirillum huttiense]
MLACLPAWAAAQPDLSRPLGPTIADTGSAWYRFSRFTLGSVDGQRSYRITLGVPLRPPPPQGYPAIVLLDGNAALAAIDEPQLQALQEGSPPVIVAVGYDTPLRFDVAARAYDYTPPIPAGQVDDETSRGRRGGGATVFLDLLQDRILPQVRQQVALDATQLSLWGHSYGGLFVLHTLFTRPGLFSRYIAASPSLWWQGGVILQEEQGFPGAAIAWPTACCASAAPGRTSCSTSMACAPSWCPMASTCCAIHPGRCTPIGRPCGARRA